VTTRHRFTVPPELDGRRLDQCLTGLRPEWSRSRVQKLIAGGHVTLAGQAAKASAVVREGQSIDVLEPPAEPTTAEAENIELDIVYEDPELLVVNKPAGLVIHPAAGNRAGTLVNALLHHCRDLSGIGGVERPGIVHRLDKDTTGLIVVAKTDRAHLGLSLAFRQRRVTKTYLTVCYGCPPELEGVIEAPIGRHPRNRRQMAVVKDGRTARTRYRVEERLAGTAIVSCSPVTGRTHQIRVHMAHIGHALVGDQLYAGRQWRNLVPPEASTACRCFPRQALHAWRLGFPHPATGDEVRFEASLPEDLVQLMDVLRTAG
jgi:23S rRNA pseudouridine1911/1915/1917 synthase